MSLASLSSSMTGVPSYPAILPANSFDSGDQDIDDQLPLLETEIPPDYTTTTLRIHPARSFKMPRSKSRHQVPSAAAEMASFLTPGSTELSRSKSFHNKLNGYDNDRNDIFYQQNRRPSVQVDYIQNRRPSASRTAELLFQDFSQLNNSVSVDDETVNGDETEDNGEDDDITEEESEMYRRRLQRPTELQFPSFPPPAVENNNHRRSASFRHTQQQQQPPVDSYHYQQNERRRDSAGGYNNGGGGRKGSIPTIAYYPADHSAQRVPKVHVSSGSRTNSRQLPSTSTNNSYTDNPCYFDEEDLEILQQNSQEDFDAFADNREAETEFNDYGYDDDQENAQGYNYEHSYDTENVHKSANRSPRSTDNPPPLQYSQSAATPLLNSPTWVEQKQCDVQIWLETGTRTASPSSTRAGSTRNASPVSRTGSVSPARTPVTPSGRMREQFQAGLNPNGSTKRHAANNTQSNPNWLQGGGSSRGRNNQGSGRVKEQHPKAMASVKPRKTPEFADQFDMYLYQSQGRRNSYCCSGDTLTAERRPSRTSNLSINNYGGTTPALLDVPRSRSRGSSLPESLASEELYRLRNFSLTGKKVVNKGDVYKTRSNTSINSMGSSVDNIDKSSYNSSHSNGTHSQRSGSYLSRSGIATPVISRGSSCANLSDNSANSTNQNIYRVLMLGASGVGKSSLCAQFVSSDKPNAYLKLEEDSVEKEVCLAVNGQERRLVFIDHPYGDLTNEDMMSRYQPHCVLVVLAVDDYNSMMEAENILDFIKNQWSRSNELAVILVANKSDLVRNRVVRTSEGKHLAMKYNVKYIETSPGINHNVDEVLVGVYKQIALREEHQQSSNKMMSLLGKMSEWGLPVPNMRAKSCSNLTTI